MELSPHEDALLQERREIVIWQVNGGVRHLVVPEAWMEISCSTGYKLNGELRKEHRLQGSFLEGKARSHKVGPRKSALQQDEICTESREEIEIRE